ncbi:MAG: hypothetical protein ACRCTD_02130 [Beijerinckiaceae bacterium]
MQWLLTVLIASLVVGYAILSRVSDYAHAGQRQEMWQVSVGGFPLSGLLIIFSVAGVLAFMAGYSRSLHKYSWHARFNSAATAAMLAGLASALFKG